MKSTGFTLIELLVSVAIIGIISAMAFAQFNEYRAKAYEAEASARSRSVFMTIFDWAYNDYDGTSNLGNISWRHYNDGTDQYTAGGEIWEQRNPHPTGANYGHYVRIDADADCVNNQTGCINGIVIHSQIWHCSTMRSDGSAFTSLFTQSSSTGFSYRESKGYTTVNTAQHCPA